MKVNDQVIYRSIAGEHILIPVGEVALKQNGLYVLNEVGALIWTMLSEGKTSDEIIAQIAEEYDAPLDTIREDYTQLTEELYSVGLLVD